MLFQKLAFPFTLLLCCISGMAQPVEFILQTDLLRPVAGYGGFLGLRSGYERGSTG